VVSNFISITSPEALVIVNSTITDAEDGPNGSIELEVSGGIEPYSFAWSNSTFENPIINIGQGQYECVVTDANGCEITFEASIIDLAVEERENSIRIFPNPTNGLVQLDRVDQGAIVRIVDGLGKIIWTNTINNSRVDIDLSTYAKGTYFIEVISEGKVVRKKLIIE
jgi:hypothetical protein